MNKDNWFPGATVRLRMNISCRGEPVTGWARRGRNAELLSVHCNERLTAGLWDVVEERET